MTTKSNPKVDAVMAKITETVIAQIKNGTAPWQKPWANRNAGGFATNLATGKEYNGLNLIYLTMLGGAHGSQFWLGYGQAKKLGGNVKKGARGTQILAPMIRKGEDKKTGEEFSYISGFRIVTVFNVAQCEGLEIPAAEDFEPRSINADALDQFVKNTGAVLNHGGDVACYNHGTDVVTMPEKDQFETEGGYYGTLLHELTHWTGHKSRLNRFEKRSRESYAFEELVAELGCYYASERIGCPNEAENHASYLASWLKALNDDPAYLWKAAARAEKAAKFLIELNETAAQKAA